MTSLTAALQAVGRAVLDLERAVDAGPDPRQLRAAAEALKDGAGQLLEAAQDIELGLVD